MREALRCLLTATSSRTTPTQIAAAVALGALTGFVPTSSLLFLILFATACLLPVHLPLLLVTTLLAAAASSLLQATFGQIGLSSLLHPNLQAIWLRLDSLPLVPWLGLHNTVVQGGLIVGVVAWLPVFLVARSVAIWILGDDWESTGRNAARESLESQSQSHETHETPEFEEHGTLVADWETQLITQDSDITIPLPSTPQVVARAARVAALVDDVLTAMEREDISNQPKSDLSASEEKTTATNSSLSGSPEPVDSERVDSEPVDPTTANPADAFLQFNSPADEWDHKPVSSGEGVSSEAAAYSDGFQAEGTIIEISVRPPRFANAEHHPTDAENTTLNLHVAQREHSSDGSPAWRQHADAVASNGKSASSGKDAGMLRNETRHQEALRYLLSHLRELKEKV